MEKYRLIDSSAIRSPRSIRRLAWDMAKARFKAKQGDGRLFVISILAMSINYALAFTVAGGTWMFYQRKINPDESLQAIYRIEPDFFNLIATFYVTLAVIACALVIPSIITLASQAAFLGAQSRSERLASLRLIGLSSGDVTAMSLIETSIQILIGAVIGMIVYLLTLPLWSKMSLLTIPINPAQMILPWWGMIAVTVIVGCISLLSTWWGLQRVRISPLGVSRRSVPPILRAWRLILFMVSLTAVIASPFLVRVSEDDLIRTIFVLSILGVTVGGYHLFMPWLLQQSYRVIAHFSTGSLMWASRRIESDPRDVWKKINGVCFLSFLGAFMAAMPLQAFTPTEENTGLPIDEITSIFMRSQTDYTKGAFIVLAIGFILSATSMFIAQAASVFERADQTIALHKMGASRRFISSANWLQYLLPSIGGILTAAPLGFLIGAAIIPAGVDSDLGQAQTAVAFMVLIILGIAILILSLLATEPIQSQILARQSRMKD